VQDRAVEAMYYSLVLLALALVFGSCAGGGGQGSVTPSPARPIASETPQFTYPPPITPNGEPEMLCLSGVGEAKSLEREAKRALENVLPTVTHRTPRPRIEVGCPSPSLIEEPRPGAVQFSCVGHVVTQRSEYRLHVYVVPQKLLERVVRSGPWGCDRLTDEEYYSVFDTARAVTRGLYLGDEELDDSQFLVEQLAYALASLPY
jgi:hypothetical protein